MRNIHLKPSKFSKFSFKASAKVLIMKKFCILHGKLNFCDCDVAGENDCLERLLKEYDKHIVDTEYLMNNIGFCYSILAEPYSNDVKMSTIQCNKIALNIHI